MKTSTTRTLWAAPMVIASLGALMSACGPQDGTAAKAPAMPQPVVAAVADPAPPAAPVQAAPTPAPQPATPAPVAKVAPVAKAAPKPAPVHTQAKEAAARPVVDTQPVVVASANLGAVQAIEPITEANPSGAGAVVGGLLGGVVGHQFGKGDGKKAMTVVGAVGGAVAGHQIEKTQNRKVVGYRVRVQLDNGDTKTFEPSQLDGLKVGDRVRIEQGALHKA